MTKKIIVSRGEEIIIHRRDGIDVFQERVSCCACGLVHDIEYRVIDDNNLGVTVWSNKRSTGQVRRHMKEKLYSYLDKVK